MMRVWTLLRYASERGEGMRIVSVEWRHGGYGGGVGVVVFVGRE
jgi:hypothetical protein